jgi:hypothetical protein
MSVYWQLLNASSTIRRGDATQTATPAAEYEDLASTYQVVQIALLNSILKAHGIADKRKRRQICEDFIFDEGLIHDEGAFQLKPGGKWFAPVLSFTDAPGDPDEGFSRSKKLYELPDVFTGYHEWEAKLRLPGTRLRPRRASAPKPCRNRREEI